MSLLPFPPNNITEAIALIDQDAEILHNIVHGDETTQVLTDNGLVPSVNNVLFDIQSRVNPAIDALTITAPFDFQTGGTVTARNQVVLWPISAGGDGREYRWAGALPKTVPAASTPASTGGISDSAWVYTADVAFEQALAAVDSTKLVGGAPAGDIAKIANNWTPYFVESYRTTGLSDSDTIQAALNAIESSGINGNRLIFEGGRLYTYDREHSIKNINDLLIDLNGATLKRADGSLTATTLSSELTVAGGTVLQLSSVPANWRVGEFITAFTSDSDVDTSQDRRRITNIAGNVVTIASAFSFSPSKTTLPIGTTVAKAFSVFSGRPSSEDSAAFPLTAGTNRRIFIVNGTIDGNRDNQLNVSWRFIPEVLINGCGGCIERVNFKNITSESFVGHGTTVRNCLYEDIGGSVYHTSVNDATEAQGGLALFTGNTCKRIGLATNDKIGHSEGAITFSWNAGNFIVSDNYFEDLTEYWLGGFGPSTGVNSDEYFSASGNIVKNAKGIMDFFSADIVGVQISGNVLHDCGNNIDKTFALSKSNDAAFFGNVLSGNTKAYQASPHEFGREHIIGFSTSIPSNIHQYRSLTNGPSFGVSNNAAGFWPTLPLKLTAFYESSSSDGVEIAYITNGIARQSFWTSDRASFTAQIAYEHPNRKMAIGTNILNGSIDLTVGALESKMRLDSDGIDMPNFDGLTLGDKDTDGSWRFAFSGNNLVIQRRESSVWVTKNTITA